MHQIKSLEGFNKQLMDHCYCSELIFIVVRFAAHKQFYMIMSQHNGVSTSDDPVM